MALGLVRRTGPETDHPILRPRGIGAVRGHSQSSMGHHPSGVARGMRFTGERGQRGSHLGLAGPGVGRCRADISAGIGVPRIRPVSAAARQPGRPRAPQGRTLRRRQRVPTQTTECCIQCNSAPFYPSQRGVLDPVRADLLGPHPWQLPADPSLRVVIPAGCDRSAVGVPQQLPVGPGVAVLAPGT